MGELAQGLWESLAGRYTLERELGRGGMAVVYLVRDLKHDRPVALKVLNPELAASLGSERFLREVRLAARLQHPHVLTVLDSGEAASRPARSGASGSPCRSWTARACATRLARERQLPVDDALRIAGEAAQALQYAHGQGVVHRDIKPENLLLTRDGNTLVADFGIARALGADTESKLTETGFVVGTPAYMSPEQAGGDSGLDARTDVYSLGAVLYEMLAGEPPFTGANHAGAAGEAAHPAGAERPGGAAAGAGAGGRGDPARARAGAGGPVRRPWRNSGRRCTRRRQPAAIAGDRRDRAGRSGNADEHGRGAGPAPAARAGAHAHAGPRHPDRSRRAVRVAPLARRRAERRRRRAEDHRGPAVREPGRLEHRLLRRRDHRRGAGQALERPRPAGDRQLELERVPAQREDTDADRARARCRLPAGRARPLGPGERRNAAGRGEPRAGGGRRRPAAHDPLAAAVRGVGHRRVPGAERDRGQGGLGARRRPRRRPEAGAHREADGEPRGVRGIPAGRARGGRHQRPTRPASSAARSATTSRRWRWTPPSRWPGLSSRGRGRYLYYTGEPDPGARTRRGKAAADRANALAHAPRRRPSSRSATTTSTSWPTGTRRWRRTRPASRSRRPMPIS